ncbi:MAG TPA: methanogenesis marker 16 metalloprotein [Methanosarcinaceae archaeon]|nr:methanogenesis marker 16 metalloprotein [Methanosarcinaceae archaeon]
MTATERTFAQIQDKLDRNEAVVLTAEEICNRIRAGECINFDDVDVVTAATRGIMSGTYVVLSFPVAEPGTFMRAGCVWLNDIPAYVGPCPNERIGVLDMIVYGTAHSRSDPDYGGGHLFRDLVEGKTIQVEVETIEGHNIKNEITLKEIPYARLFATRHAFKNYLAFVNPKTGAVPSIFHAVNFNGDLGEATFCGCGELNPIKNDPDLETIGIGTRVLINGAEGYVSGSGTRSTPDKPNFAGFADMHDMIPGYMGGFLTSAGPEIINTWAVPIPILNPGILDNITKLDSDLKLTIVDVNNRLPICDTTYGDVWDGADVTVAYQSGECMKCDVCEVEQACPMGAVTYRNNVTAVHDAKLCFNCGLCTTNCAGNAFSANLGTLHYNDGEIEKDIPVVIRQSDRARAVKAAGELKKMIISGDFEITEPVGHIVSASKIAEQIQKNK